MSTGVVFASTGGHKIVRAVWSFRKMEPEVKVHVVLTTNTATHRTLHEPKHDEQLAAMGAELLRVTTTGFVNGSMNHAVLWIKRLGFENACVLHDDLVFSPLVEHVHSLSSWFDAPDPNSGLTFAHFECLTSDTDMRREPWRWDAMDLADWNLWRELMTFDREHNGSPVYPSQYDFFVRYEGTDRTRPWNRLGPTGFIVPIKLWEEFGGFDEQYGVFYDHDYPAEVCRRDLPPVYAVPNVPWLHLHNQSVNPWADPAIGHWGDSDGAFTRKFGLKLTDFWHGDWERRWLDRTSNENRTTSAT
jgi:hypothetical protein